MMMSMNHLVCDEPPGNPQKELFYGTGHWNADGIMVAKLAGRYGLWYVDGDCFLVGDVTRASNMKRRVHLGTFSPTLLIGNFVWSFLIFNYLTRPLILLMDNG